VDKRFVIAGAQEPALGIRAEIAKRAGGFLDPLSEPGTNHVRVVEYIRDGAAGNACGLCHINQTRHVFSIGNH